MGLDPRGDKLGGIAHQVGEALGEEGFLGQDERERGAELHVGPGRLQVRVLLHGVPGQLLQLQRPQLQGLGRHLGQGEHILNQVLGTAGGVVDLLQILLGD